MENNDFLLKSYLSSRQLSLVQEENAAPSSRGSIKSSNSATANARARQELLLIEKAVSSRRLLAGSYITHESNLHVIRKIETEDEEVKAFEKIPAQHEDAPFKKKNRLGTFYRLLTCTKIDEDNSIGRDSFENLERRTSKKAATSLSKRKIGGRRRSMFVRSILNKALNPQKIGIEENDVSDLTRMQRLVMEMKDCLSFLGDKDTPDEKLEKWACIVYESMSASSRTFHGVQHVFDVSLGKDEIQKLCAFFHDVIYYTIDGGLTLQQTEFLDGIVVDNDGEVSLTESSLEEELELVTDIFGFVKGQKLNPFKGLNEYLSAALAVRCLSSSSLKLRHLAEIVACIEATIPFREGDPMEDLYQRLISANETYNLEMSEPEIVVAVQRAADFANTDVYNFSLENKAVFLSNTWNLLPESNISLRHVQVFRVSHYSLAMKKMTGFFSFLKAETIYSSFRNKPDDEMLTELTAKAAENISIALTYMNCKHLALALLGAFAVLTGGDAPVAMFLGDLPDGNYISPCIDDMIQTKKKMKGVILDERVFALLRDGRESESDFDIKHSPCSALLYAHIGDAGLEEALKHVVHPMDQENSKALLMTLPKQCVIEIGLACSHIAITRAAALKEIVKKIQEGTSL